MPRYDFACAEHGEFEVKRHFGESLDVVCPICQQPARHLYGRGAAVIMRPDGWNLSPSDPAYSYNLRDKEKPSAWMVAP